MKKILIICLAVLFAAAPGVWAGKAYPKRNIQAAVVWGAGGGTDTCVRVITAEMQKFMDKKSPSSTKPVVWQARSV